MSRMPENQFLRVHRSYAVFVHFIDEITRDQVLIGNAQVDIPVSRQYYNELKKQITTLYLESKVEKKSKQNG